MRCSTSPEAEKKAGRAAAKKKGLLGGGDDSDDDDGPADGEGDDDSDDDEEEEPAWRKERAFLPSELELELGESPFETVHLSLGSKFGSMMQAPDFRTVARFKVGGWRLESV